MKNAPAPDVTDAWMKLGETDDPSSVPSLVNLFPRAELPLKRKTISVLGNIGEQAVTDALVQIALAVDEWELREAAAAELADRSFAIV